MATGASLSLTRQHAAALAARGLPPLLVAALRVAATVAPGVHGRRRVGTGDSFWQFRPYATGDAISRIDWRQSAKSDGLFIRDQEWEAAQSLWLWRDPSASMHYQSASALPLKRERAEVLTLALASLLLRGGERVALLGDGIAPSASRSILPRLASRLTEMPEGGDGLPPSQTVPRHARLVLMGDFFTAPATLEARLCGLANHGVRGHLVQVLDPAELALPFKGRVRFFDREGADEMLARRVEDIRPAYQARLSAHSAALADMARRLGWSFARHSTDQAPTVALVALYQQLSDGAGRARGGEAL
jgi:uncharacterized protein (DUF58 family)